MAILLFLLTFVLAISVAADTANQVTRDSIVDAFVGHLHGGTSTDSNAPDSMAMYGCASIGSRADGAGSCAINVRF